MIDKKQREGHAPYARLSAFDDEPARPLLVDILPSGRNTTDLFMFPRQRIVTSFLDTKLILLKRPFALPSIFESLGQIAHTYSTVAITLGTQTGN